MKERPALPSHAVTLPARYYTDPVLFAREEERLFSRGWTCVGRLEELPEPGAFITRRVAGDSILLVRTSTDAAPAHPAPAHLAPAAPAARAARAAPAARSAPAPPAAQEVSSFFNVCRHRGTTICTESHGHLQGSIQCPYHAWTYAYDGRLMGAPHMDNTVGFRKEDYPLRAVRADVWDGFVFVNTSSSGPGLLERLADLPQKFAPWRMGHLRAGARLEYDIRANWKLIIQNFSECLHCPNLHPVLNKLSHYLSGENEPLRPSYMGGVMDLSDGVETMSMDGTRSCDYLPSLGEGERRRVYYYAIFPNLLISAHPDYVMAHTLWPMAPDRTRLVCEFLFHPDALSSASFNPSKILEFWDMTNKQDWFVCELAQQGIQSRGYVPGPYSNREELLHAFDRFIVDALRDTE